MCCVILSEKIAYDEIANMFGLDVQVQYKQIKNNV